MTVTKRTRYEVLKRDNHTCRYCGASAPDAPLRIDHVTPVALGGSDAPSNLVTACQDCNAGKSSTSPDASLVEDVKQADLAWADAMKRAAELRAAAREVQDDYIATFELYWGPRYRPTGYETSLISLYEAGLPEDEMKDAVLIAQGAPYVTHSRFRYFMGVSWRKVRDLQDIARSLIESEEQAD